MSQTRSVGWLVAGAALVAAGMRVPEIALPGTWLALALLLRGFRGLPPRTGFPGLALALYAALAVGNRGIIPVKGPVYLVIVALDATLAFLPFVLDRWARGRTIGWASTLAFPGALVAQEFLRSRIPGGPGSWSSFAYTQYGNLPLMQLSAVTGIWGITFALAWTASTACWVWERGLEWDRVRTGLLAWAGVLGTVTVAGVLRLALQPAPEAVLRAATVTFPQALFTPGEMFRIADGRTPVDDAVAAKLARLHDWFFETSEREARAGARLVAWPEMNFLVLADDEPAALARAQRMAAQEHIYLAMGIGAVHPGRPKPFQNKAVLVDPAGRIAWSYLKSRPVLGWEESVMERGDGRLPILATGIGRISTAICFEGDHPDLVRQVGRGEADLWILPVNDWPEVKRIHLAMAAFRAVENGTPILRPASFGVSAAFDALGRALGETDHLSGASTLVVEVPVGNVPTFYARVGDLFAWLCVAGTILAPILAPRWLRDR